MTARPATETLLITGAAGYIGAVLVPALLERGFRIRAVDRFFFGDTLPDHPALQKIREDVRCLPPEQLEGIDAVVDLAALSNDPTGERFSEATRAINHQARYRTARLARERAVPRYLLPSSCSVYGHAEGIAGEQDSTFPLTTYARANLDVESDVLALADDSFSVTVLRQATVFGPSPRMRFDLAINAMVHDAFRHRRIRIMRDGRQWRPFLHVADAAEAIIRCLQADRNTVNHQIFNVGSSAGNMQLGPLADTLCALLGEQLGHPVGLQWYGDADHRSYRVDFSRLVGALGWSPQRRIGTGALEVLAGLRAGQLEKTPRSITLDWYRQLQTEQPGEILLHGGILDIDCRQ